MTAEEKAEELVRKYYTFGLNNPAQSFSWYECQQCALIAVEEVINSMTVATSVYLPFWQEVKIEIEKL